VSLANATAFSPTDAMPLTPPAKRLAAESTLSAITVLLIAARAVKILA
jgi:hypothetical protein